MCIHKHIYMHSNINTYTQCIYVCNGKSVHMLNFLVVLIPQIHQQVRGSIYKNQNHLSHSASTRLGSTAHIRGARSGYKSLTYITFINHFSCSSTVYITSTYRDFIATIFSKMRDLHT